MRREDDPNDAVPEEKPGSVPAREGIGGKSTLIVAALLLVIFFLQNLENANIDFLFWEWDVGIAAAIGLAAPRPARAGGRVDAPTGAPHGTARRPARLASTCRLRQRAET